MPQTDRDHMYVTFYIVVSFENNFVWYKAAYRHHSMARGHKL